MNPLDVEAILATWLSIAGLGLDLAAAALLAYDALYGPRASKEASALRTRLAIARASHERYERGIGELSSTGPASDNDARGLVRELSALSVVIGQTTAQLTHWERHEHRAQVLAVLGLLLLMAGFACQAAAPLLMNLLP